MSGHYMQFSPSAVAAAMGSSSSPHRGSLRPSSSQSSLSEHDKYFAELLEEQQIIRISEYVRKWPPMDQDTLDRGSPLSSMSNSGFNGWGSFQSERLGFVQSPSSVWHGGGSPEPCGSPTIKKTIRIEVPVDKYPNFNFVGRILGPRGNSLKRVESMTRCRVYIRGRGSIKDVAKEEKMRDKAGYEHLNEPLHLLVEAELPANVIDFYLSKAGEILEDLLRPVDETMDIVKKAQLRELALLNGTLREDSPSTNMSGSVSPFSNSGMKRAKTRK